MKLNFKQFVKGGLIGSALFSMYVVTSNVKYDVLAWHGQLNVEENCEGASATLTPYPDSQVTIATINGLDTTYLFLEWGEDNTLEFNGQISWETNEIWNGNEVVSKPENCDIEPTETPTVEPTESPEPTVSPSPTVEPTTTPSPTSTPKVEDEPESRCEGLSASPTGGVAPLTVRFTGSGFDEDGKIKLYKFDFGDASDGQSQIWEQEGSEAYHRYQYEGKYFASLHVKDSRGNWRNGNDDCKVEITVSNRPQVLGASTTNELPKTGSPITLFLGLISLSGIGAYLRKKFLVY
jgi:LPXTG-motif cell wall-anchored protein